MSNHYVILTKPNCPWCAKAKHLLTANGLGFSEFDVTEHTDYRDFLYALDTKTVPQIFTKGHWIGGYNDLEEAFAYTNN